MPTNQTVARRNNIAQVSHGSMWGVVCVLTIPLVFAALVAAVAWLFWMLASGLLGPLGAAFTVAVLSLGTVTFSWRSGRGGFAGTLIMVGFGSFALLTAVLFGIAGYKLVLTG
jgi:hypothetical protein